MESATVRVCWVFSGVVGDVGMYGVVVSNDVDL